MKINEILLRRKNLIWIEENNKDAARNLSIQERHRLVAAIGWDIQQFGYTFSKDLSQLLVSTVNDYKGFYDELIQHLRMMTSSDVEYHCMYPGFPSQVLKMSDDELNCNALFHYLFPIEVPCVGEAEPHPSVKAEKTTELGIGTFSNVIDIFNNLVSSKTSISSVDKEDINTFITNYRKEYDIFLPKEIPHKEVKAIVLNYLYEDKNFDTIKKYLNTATDVLRFWVVQSDGDGSLSFPVRFAKMNRPTRRFIMDCLKNCPNLLEDIWRYPNEWKRLGEIIHPREFGENYANVKMAFNSIRNHKKPTFFLGEVNQLIAHQDFKTAAELLSERPGEFARKLDSLLRSSSLKTCQEILDTFEYVAAKVSIPVLLQVRTHFTVRPCQQSIRVFFPKGRMAKLYYTENNLKKIPKEICKKVFWICGNAIQEQLAKRSSLGKVWIDPRLENFVIPFSRRTASRGKIPLTRGTRIPLEQNAHIVRGFIHWTNNKGIADGYHRIDVDLSAGLYDEDWKLLQHISYTNLRSRNFGAAHSGDIINGGPVDGDGATEFIDVNLDTAKEKSVRYVVFQAHNYSGFDYSEMTNCRFGWMEREDNFIGETFEPSTLKNRIDLTVESNIACPVIFDLERREAVWCDMAISNGAYENHPNNIESNINKTTALYYAMTQTIKPDLWDLAYLNAKARGKLVDNKNEADTIFSLTEGITPYDIDTIVNDLM